MNGLLDEDLRALVTIQIGPPETDAAKVVMVWVDTAFNGSQYGLLGTMLLEGRKLVGNYDSKSVSIE